MLFFEFQEKLESNRPEKFESNGPFEQIDLWNRPIGLFICKEIAISAKEPNWALLMLKNGRISGYTLYFFTFWKMQLRRSTTLK